MKKHIVPLLILSTVLIVGCASKQATNTADLANFELKGSVKSVESHSYNANNSIGISVKTNRGVVYIESFISYDKTLFSPEGQILNEAALDCSGLPAFEVKHKYGQNKKLISKQFTEIYELGYENSTSKSETIYDYNKNGKLISTKVTDLETELVTDWKMYEYNSKGDKIKEIGLTITGKDTLYYKNSSLTHKYNENGVKVLSIITDGNQERKLEHNAKGLLVLDELKIKNEDKYLEKTTYSYTNQGLKVSYYQYDANGELFFEEHRTYNNDELLIEKEISFEIEGSYDKDILTYNQNKQLIKEQTFDLDGNLKNTIEFVYKNDRYGNWTQRITYKNGEPNAIVERKITYHK